MALSCERAASASLIAVRVKFLAFAEQRSREREGKLVCARLSLRCCLLAPLRHSPLFCAPLFSFSARRPRREFMAVKLAERDQTPKGRTRAQRLAAGRQSFCRSATNDDEAKLSPGDKRRRFFPGTRARTMSPRTSPSPDCRDSLLLHDWDRVAHSPPELPTRPYIVRACACVRYAARNSGLRSTPGALMRHR